ncbi:MAG: Holliday junction ATP-dependent DNA helicase RuvA [Hyphomicrobiaceae bacterium hypho_1]
MIGKLRGIVDAIGDLYCVIDVGGVGYEVQASTKTLRAMTEGVEVVLRIDTHVREDAIKLYGFSTEIERSVFRSLQSVQGVGAKMALSVLGILEPVVLANAIATGDWVAISQTPGIGKKIAQRIVAELKDKVPASSFKGLHTSQRNIDVMSKPFVDNAATSDAISALCNLGYQPSQASQAVALVIEDLGENAQTEELIRSSLKSLSNAI